VRPAAQHSEHPPGISDIEWLGEEDVVDDDRGVGADYERIWFVRRDRLRFFYREPFSVPFRQLARDKRFVDVRGKNFVRNSDKLEKLTAARRL
jgi:hypothetical protein